MSSSEAAETLRAETEDGVRLSLRRRRGDGPPVLLTHAMMANGSVFERKGRGLAPWLAARGFDAFVLDFRGHGVSVPPEPRRDAWTFDDYV
ncbi:MAG: hypothetical protein K8I02_06905, partial [Candidatus Methylomirabilis sp.]|nr:hypothetical protein [Deltaproteobacteria bacterium]